MCRSALAGMPDHRDRVRSARKIDETPQIYDLKIYEMPQVYDLKIYETLQIYDCFALGRGQARSYKALAV